MHIECNTLGVFGHKWQMHWILVLAGEPDRRTLGTEGARQQQSVSALIGTHRSHEKLLDRPSCGPVDTIRVPKKQPGEMPRNGLQPKCPRFPTLFRGCFLLAHIGIEPVVA